MMLDGVGSMVNNIARAKMLGAALSWLLTGYEELLDKNQRLCFDAGGRLYPTPTVQMRHGIPRERRVEVM